MLSSFVDLLIITVIFAIDIKIVEAIIINTKHLGVIVQISC